MRSLLGSPLGSSITPAGAINPGRPNDGGHHGGHGPEAAGRRRGSGGREATRHLAKPGCRGAAGGRGLRGLRAWTVARPRRGRGSPGGPGRSGPGPRPRPARPAGRPDEDGRRRCGDRRGALASCICVYMYYMYMYYIYIYIYMYTHIHTVYDMAHSVYSRLRRRRTWRPARAPVRACRRRGRR